MTSYYTNTAIDTKNNKQLKPFNIMKTLIKVSLHSMRNGFILLVFFLSIVNYSSAQITTQEYPPSFYEGQNFRLKSQEPNKIRVPNVEAYIQEDKIVDTIKSIPWRFGHAIDVSFDLKKDGLAYNDREGNRIWRLSVSSKDAVSINLNFDDFYLSENAKLFVYGDGYNDVIGAITAANNKETRLFATRPIQGDVVYVELIAPLKEFNKNELSIHQLVYGYRDLREKALKVFKSSASCNININCEEGDDWQEVKRAIAMITTSSNTRLCTGVLVNNVKQDTTPYLLTGAHCRTPNNAVFIFGYESDKCSPNTDGILTNSITGATTRAAAPNNFTDFELLELSSKPPSSYNVFYAGWSAEDVPSEHSTTIHHPAGDVKKITVDSDPSISSGYYNTAGSTHWTVANWEDGSTQGGSSGAPLFDQNQRIIGLLQGGEANCNNKAQDYYGKFSKSWDDKSSITQQLKAWLDPDSTGTIIMDGLSPDSAANNKDLHLVNIGSIPIYSCDTIISPKVTVRNIGNDTIFSIDVHYDINGGANSIYSLNDTILRNQLVEISIPSINVIGGVHSFNANAKIGNGINDQDSSNNKKLYAFQVAKNTQTYSIELKTDDYGEETTWALVDANTGFKLSFGGPYVSVTGGQVIKKDVCVPDSTCFYAELFDSEDDGFNGVFGSGYFLIKDQNGDTLSLENNFKNGYTRDTFCMNSTLITNLAEFNTKQLELTVYPNPIKRGGILTIATENLSLLSTVQLIDATGRVISESRNPKIVIPASLAKGIYFLRINAIDQRLFKIEKIIVD